ncbi:SAGA-associated factor 11 homolog [Diaphorina citri]|jgi:hypothetical protein|uniref:SAGA-associated factor 11 homolog n=1 Tax=Diaphorina citri TaxID=121845 RepID=A0A1S4E732_DIACI|nr:SAGA-associated factor 11 homolog [Diaphorina citri]XP_026676708.1 SAGA-associated factor 11 homolog [Diaphorina citri]XP_026676709.1 SAGA-associated factor 11 homolog [Diaphorina citri]KAI5709774.1 hypothetical protein M8J75_003135 [Diaphorina citri]KAI5752406.1 hypothetical protein M8J77_016701 [Diaphorina citri]
MFGTLDGTTKENHSYGAPLNIEFTEEDFIRASRNPDVCEQAAKMIFDSQVDKLILGICFDVHRLNKAVDPDTLLLYFDNLTFKDEASSHILNTERHMFDVYGNEFTTKKILVKCPICHKSGYDGTKLSNHLESHKNFKRSSSLVARERIAASQVKYKDEEENDKTVPRKAERKKKLSKLKKQANNHGL